MSVVEFRITGEADLLRVARKLERGVPRAQLQPIVRKSGAPIRERMAQLAPHRPGKPDLRDTVIVEDLERGVSIGVAYDVGVAIGPSLKGFYGFYQEFGTAHHGAQPFARPAFDQTDDEAFAIMEVEWWATVRLLIS